jgi:hypothetical protein
VVIGRIAVVVLSVSMFTSRFAAAEEWPTAMTRDELSARTNVHDGYVFHVLSLTTAPVEQRGQPSQSTFDYVAGYSSKLERWILVPDGHLPKGLTYIGVRATLRAVQPGGENWQAMLTGPTGRVKRLFVTAYQAQGPGGLHDCFADYLTQRSSCGGRTAEVLWFVETRCLQPGVSTFALQDVPTGGEQPVARLTVTAPGKSRTDRPDPCAIKPTPVTEHDQDPDEQAFQFVAQRELPFGRISLPAANTALTFQLVSDGHLLLTDDRGRHTGFDLTRQVVHEEIPGSSYQERAIPPALAAEPHAKPLRSIGVVDPESSEYVLSVERTQAEPYWLSVGRFQQGRSIILIQADPHVSSDIAYRIQLHPPDVRQALRVIGAFNGGTNPRPGGLLTFASPTTARTELPRGTTRTDLLVFYDAGIDPESLRARLNGREASMLFHPYAGWREVARIPLAPGVNRLDLVIKGVIDRERRTERVHLMFVVPVDPAIHR